MKRVLIISYYWPPAGGVSVLRCLKFAKYLRQFGWEPIVYAPSNATYLFYDDSNFKDVPAGIEVLKHRIREPFMLFRFLSGRMKDDPADPVHVRQRKSFIDGFAIWVRGNFFVPDARCLWINPSVSFLKKYLKNHPVDAIFTDGPPHTNTLIGLKLSVELGIPWLADFQDPWTQVDYYRKYKISGPADRRHKKLEQTVFRTAHKITIASPSWARDLERIGARNVDVLYSGFDQDDVHAIPRVADEDFTITHTGLLSSDRNPEVFFRVLKDLKSELPGFSEKLRLTFAGNIDITVREKIAENGLTENFHDVGFIDRSSAIRLIAGARMLLLPLNRAENVTGRIPAKFYEYLMVERPILCLGPENTDLAAILEESGAGVCIGSENYDKLKIHVREQFERYLEGDSCVSPKNIERFSISSQTEILSGYLSQITQ